MKKFILEIYLRLKAKSPKMFEKLRLMLITMTTVCTSLVQSGINFEIMGFDLPKIIGLLSAGGWVVTYFAVEDGEALAEKLSKETSN